MRRVAAAGVTALLIARSAAALDVTACGALVPDGETGVLQADIDCSLDPADGAVALGNRSTLDMNGHAIVGRRIAVFCGSDPHSRGCTVRGPGDVSGGN